MRRYAQTYNVDVMGRTAAWVGLDSGSGAIYVEGKGDTSPALAKALRLHFPGHSVPRLDVAEDYDEEGAFDQLLRVSRLAKGDRVKSGYGRCRTMCRTARRGRRGCAAVSVTCGFMRPGNIQTGCTWAGRIGRGSSWSAGRITLGTSWLLRG